MNTFVLLLLGFSAFIVQYFLTFLQMKKFTKHYREFRKKGRVAIGKCDGAVRAGSIVMFSIDRQGVITNGKYIQGVTVFARYKNISQNFIGKYIGELTQSDCRAAHYSKPLTRAIIDARNNYNIVSTGGTLPERKSPLNRLFDAFTLRTSKKIN